MIAAPPPRPDQPPGAPAGPAIPPAADAVPPAPRTRQLLLMAIPALIIGVLSALILRGLELVAHLLQGALWESLPAALGVDPAARWWIVVILTATGIGVGLVLWLVPGHGGVDSATTELVAEPLKLRVLPSLALAVILALAGGVSLGPENPIIAINTALAVALMARLSKRVPTEIAVLLAAAATIGALFGTPVAAALVFTGIVAAVRRGGSLWDRLFLPLVAAGAGAVTTHVVGGGIGAVGGLAPYGDGDPLDILLGALIASVAAGFALLGVWVFPHVHRLFRMLRNPLAYAAAGGLVLGLLGFIGGPITLFKGLEQSGELITHADDYDAGQLAVIVVVKLLALVVAAASGFRGGRVFPAVFIGVAFGMLGHALLPAIPLGLAIACGVLGLTLAVARDGWIGLFVAVAIVGDITVLPALCLVILPTWLVVRAAPEMIVHPGTRSGRAEQGRRDS